MKTLTIAVAALVLVSATAPAGVIHKRQKHQRARIREGVQSGELTPRERSKLRAEEKAIESEREAAQADGKITKGERRAIRHDQNRVSRDIYRKKHNARDMK
jgi:hypothetical protein